MNLRKGGGGEHGLCHSPNQQGVWWPPKALGLKMLPGALCTDSLFILLQFYVQFQGQIQEFLGGVSFPTGGGGWGGSKIYPRFLQSDAFCDPFNDIPKGYILPLGVWGPPIGNFSKTTSHFLQSELFCDCVHDIFKGHFIEKYIF